MKNQFRLLNHSQNFWLPMILLGAIQLSNLPKISRMSKIPFALKCDLHNSSRNSIRAKKWNFFDKSVNCNNFASCSVCHFDLKALFVTDAILNTRVTFLSFILMHKSFFKKKKNTSNIQISYSYSPNRQWQRWIDNIETLRH